MSDINDERDYQEERQQEQDYRDQCQEPTMEIQQHVQALRTLVGSITLVLDAIEQSI